MPIFHFLTIDGVDQSPFLIQADIDMVIPANYQENNVQHADLTLSNVNGRFEGLRSVGMVGVIPEAPENQTITDFSTLSHVSLVLVSLEYTNDIDNPKVYAAIVFAGVCQHIDYSYLTVKIHCATEDNQGNPYIHWDINKHQGKTTEPILYDLMSMLGVNVGTIQFPDLKKREWQFLRDNAGKNVLDYLAEWDGYENFMNENNQLVHTPPVVYGTNPSFTGRMRMPMQSESAIGLCTKVRVVGASFLPPDADGSENIPADVAQYETTNEDLAYLMTPETGGGGEEAAAQLLANFGTIRAPTFFFPECTTPEECKQRATAILARYLTFWNRTTPAVVGRTPKLRSYVSYQYKRLLNTLADDGWQLTPEQKGRCVRAKTCYGSKSGWYTILEVQPWAINEANRDTIYGVGAGSIGGGGATQ